jgi:hypothetical protein
LNFPLKEGEISMETRSRWYKVANLVEKALRDEELLEAIRGGEKEARLEILRQNDFTEEDIDQLWKDFNYLYPEVRTAVPFW